MDEIIPAWLYDETLPRVIGRDAALRRGMSTQAVDRRVMTKQWRRLLPRTYLTADTLTELDRVVAALTFAGNGAALSGAAALWTSRVPRVALPREILVVVPRTSCVASTAWVRIRRSVRPLVYELAPGPKRVELGRATADLAVTLTSLDDVRTIVARVVQRGFCTLDEVEQACQDGPMRGSRYLRQVLAEVGRGAESAPEAVAANILDWAGISGWRANESLLLPNGVVRRVDFLWPHLRAVLEIDSVEWHYEVDQWSRSWDRHLDLTKFGYSVIHRPPSALRDRAGFAADISAWLAGREGDLRRGLG